MTSRYYRLLDIIVNYYIKTITISYHIVSPFPGSIEYRPIPTMSHSLHPFYSKSPVKSIPQVKPLLGT